MRNWVRTYFLKTEAYTYRGVFLIALFGLGLSFVSCERQKSNLKPSQFTYLEASDIGIDFANNLQYTEDFNVYIFRAFYNGAGVGLGDFNNDGLLDVYFSGNQVDNSFYLNQGDFNFKDVTKKAGVSSSGVWSTGVSVIDINNDGWLDILVCKSGVSHGKNRHNELFINNGTLKDGGIPTFTESAEAYGIADVGFSIHAVFFDYDKDGDLDFYLSNNSLEPTSMVVDATAGLRDIRDPKGGNKLYRNDGVPKSLGGTGTGFTDVSEQAGIYASAIGFGLGVSIGDINRDGWPDIFVANDFFEKDYLYINQADGTFKESLESTLEEISLGSMGVDIVDMNNDGYPEIFVTEMLPEDETRLKSKTVFDDWDSYRLKVKNGYHRQFPRNVFQLNNGVSNKSVHFSEISRFSGVEATDWSWGAFMADFDNNGKNEIFVTNGMVKDLQDHDFADYYFNPQKLREIYKKEGAVIKKLIDSMPSEPIPNYMYKNRGGLQFSNVSEEWGLGQNGFSTGAAYGDMDNDGDLDLIVSNNNMPPFIYRNETKGGHFLNLNLIGPENNKGGIGSQVTLKVSGKRYFKELYPMRGSMSSVDPRLHFGLKDDSSIDTLQVRWSNGSVTTLNNIKPDQFLTVEYNLDKTNAEVQLEETRLSMVEGVDDRFGLDYVHQENDFVDFDYDKLLLHMNSSEGPKIAVGDVNNNGLPDVFVGASKGFTGGLYQMQASGKFLRTNTAIFEESQGSEDTDAVFVDVDNDGDQDLIVASGGYEFSANSFALADRLYKNDGKGNFSKPIPITPANKLVSTSCLALSDYDKDGDMDIFLGGRYRPLSYGLPESGYILENDGKGNFKSVLGIKVSDLTDIGMITDASWFDIDRDGDDDLVLVGDWMSIKVFINTHGTLQDATDTWGFTNEKGFWNVLHKSDVDKDGDYDLIVGNLGTNTMLRASRDNPVSMYVNDFDGNSKIDHIITVGKNGKSYPVAQKKDITGQLTYLRKRYLKSEDYALQTVQDIFKEEQIENSLRLDVLSTASAIFWNENGHFEKQELPYEAQLGPVYAIETEDLDGDGNNEIILGGNLFKAKPQIGIYSGLQGVVLKYLGDKKFESISATNSGFFVRGEIRDIKRIELDGKKSLLVSRNNDTIKLFKATTK
ncbi:MAG: VCBS repeat-containing protein [Flavobacteriaceae bacterium]|nr:VCBS repeat-containing protein [Flavobacteriaceae bacterium]